LYRSLGTEISKIKNEWKVNEPLNQFFGIKALFSSMEAQVYEGLNIVALMDNLEVEKLKLTQKKERCNSFYKNL
jgi:hypothetical protein